MRQIKDNYEIDLTQKAIDISILGHKSTIKNATPGMYEYQLRSLMEYEFSNAGSERPAYSSIIGSGINACYLHYINNDAKCKEGDLVLMDCGAKYHGYCADITRTFPVSGKFTEEQKILYNIVLEAQDSALIACKPGEQFTEIHNRAKALINKRLIDLNILSDDDKVDIYFPHGTSHFLGLDVHDVGEKRILEPGMILTVEPGIYIPAGSHCDKKWWNNGIRIEDDILITEYGYKNLSGKMPKTIEEIEKLMSE
jgi:Xaa-Pro aminopeptidase